jgi:protoheme IX farnesyltransferase
MTTLATIPAAAPLDDGPGAVSAAPFDGSVPRARRYTRFADYQVLSKVRLNMMVLVSTAVGFHMASPAAAAGGPSNHPAFRWLLFLNALIGTGLTAAASGVLNQWIEIDRDRLMPRTRNRPLPAGRISPREGLILGIVLAVAGLGYLLAFTNVLTFALGAATLAVYLFIYTPLKVRSTLNTIVGAVPGAIPPLIGYAAAADVIDWKAMVLFAILFLWQMPHFLAIATMYREDYRAGGYKMLPVLDTDLTDTARQSVLYLGALLVTSLIPTLFHFTGPIYTIVALLLGGAFLATGLQFAMHRTRKDARVMFFASISYLPLLLIAMVFDKV